MVLPPLAGQRMPRGPGNVRYNKPHCPGLTFGWDSVKKAGLTSAESPPSTPTQAAVREVTVTRTGPAPSSLLNFCVVHGCPLYLCGFLSLVFWHQGPRFFEGKHLSPTRPEQFEGGSLCPLVPAMDTVWAWRIHPTSLTEQFGVDTVSHLSN